MAMRRGARLLAGAFVPLKGSAVSQPVVNGAKTGWGALVRPQVETVHIQSCQAWNGWKVSAMSFASQPPPRSTTGGPVSFASLGLMMVTGSGLFYAYKQMKDSKIEKATEQKTISVGKAKVGGPFQLINQDGKAFSDKDLHGEFSLLYFGFCTCPDICPDELEKLSAAIDAVEMKTGAKIQPVFITVDPERDSVKRIKSYVKEFHPRLIGLTGSKEQTDSAAKAYRVYYMKTDDSKDYLIDHSIIMYLLDPHGDFVTFFGKNFTEEQLGNKMASIVSAWAETHDDYKIKE